jgi:HEPN domain-containing protein
MTGHRWPPDDPREWLNRARSNLARAKAELPEVYLEDLCFDAQQAAEKAIKAVLISQNKRFPHVHDLAQLLSLAEESGLGVPEEIKKTVGLTRYAVVARYPAISEPVTADEHREALELASNILAWAEAMIKKEESIKNIQGKLRKE